jgi:hypothetical protein
MYEQDISSVGEGKLEVKRTRYDKLVEDVVSEKVCRDEGLDPEKSARVVVGRDADGDPELHVFGRSREAVDVVADGIRSPRASVRRRYIGRNVSPDEERGLMHPALNELFRSLPAAVGSPAELLRVVKGLPLMEQPALEEGVTELGEALKGFSPGSQTKKELERKEG